MAGEPNRLPKEEWRANREQQSEIGDILLSARSVARQMIAQAKEQAEGILKDARERADEIAKDAEERKSAALREAEEAKAAVLREAAEQADAVIRKAEEDAAAVAREGEEQKAAILREAAEQKAALLQAAEREAEEEKAAILRRAEESAAVLLQHAEDAAAVSAESERCPAPEIPADMQEYVVRCVGDCFERLRRQQLEAADLINEQWRSFLSGLVLTDEPAAPAAPEGDISPRELEDRVGAIAQEMKEISEL